MNNHINYSRTYHVDGRLLVGVKYTIFSCNQEDDIQRFLEDKCIIKIIEIDTGVASLPSKVGIFYTEKQNKMTADLSKEIDILGN